MRLAMLGVVVGAVGAGLAGESYALGAIAGMFFGAIAADVLRYYGFRV